MAVTLPAVVEKLRTPEGIKFFRYSMASVVAVAVSVVCLVFFKGVLGMSGWVSSTLATAIAAIPSYEMNRKWAWGKSGRSHVLKEVVPFWALAFLGWAFSTYSVAVTEHLMRVHHVGHVVDTTGVTVVYIAAFGVLWVGKFIIFNRLLFVHRPGDIGFAEHGVRPARAGRSDVTAP